MTQIENASESEDATVSIHLETGGRIIVTHGTRGRVGTTSGTHESAHERDKPEWNRSSMSFNDGGQLRLIDKPRLDRTRLKPNIEALGNNAAEIDRDEFRR